MNQTCRQLCLVLFAVLIPTGISALPWDEDMRNAPSIKPQEALVFTNPTSVPMGIDEPWEKPANLSELVRARLKAGEDLMNPVQETSASLSRGKELYDTHCYSCHGSTGEGDGPVGLKYIPQPMNLLADYVQLQPAGRLFYTITHGGIAMPVYRESISVGDRWHLVNYVKNRLGQAAE